VVPLLDQTILKFINFYSVVKFSPLLSNSGTIKKSIKIYTLSRVLYVSVCICIRAHTYVYTCSCICTCIHVRALFNFILK